MDDQTYKTIKDIINEHLDPKEHKAFIFGSRATGDFRKYSDFDIGVTGDRLKATVYFDLESAFEESDLPYTVDVVDFNDLSEEFINVAMKQVIPLNY